MAVALARLQHILAHQHKPHARHALDALAGGSHQRIERHGARIDLDRAERTHRIDDQSLAQPLAQRGDLRQRVQHAGAGLAMHLSHVRDRRVARQRLLDQRGRGRLVFGDGQFHAGAAQHLADLQDALAVRAVLRHQYLAVAGHHVGDGRFHGKGAAALHWHAHMGAFAVDDAHQVIAQAARDAVEAGVPRSPVAQHGLLGRERGGEGAGGQKDRVVAADHGERS
ncbi:hypothetical protein D3C81_931650 [compost metagenome]